MLFQTPCALDCDSLDLSWFAASPAELSDWPCDFSFSSLQLSPAEPPPMDTCTGVISSPRDSKEVPPRAPLLGSATSQNDSGYLSSASAGTPVSGTPVSTSLPLRLDIPTKAVLDTIYKHWQTETMSSGPQERPDESYLSMIARCMLSSPDGCVVMADIYDFILERHPYFRTAKPTWKNSVRHCLSVNDCFVKGRRARKGRGNQWSIHPGCLESFKQGDFTRRLAKREAQHYNRRAAGVTQTKAEVCPPFCQPGSNNYQQMTSTPMHPSHVHIIDSSSHTHRHSSHTPQLGNAYQPPVLSAQERFSAIQARHAPALGYYQQGYMSQSLAMDFRH